MADLRVFEKYPDSWRIDHENFGDVSKTNYAKGVITEFKLDDPNDFSTIKSLVKVKVIGQESDFIPLCYHPKAQYWDGYDFPATVFNQDKKYFEKAWMSFRAGDEVAVIIREGLPFAVIGFADGKPRIGEDILKISFNTAAAGQNYMLWKFLGLGAPENYPVAGLNPGGGVLNPWNGDEKGPDGFPLGLTEECPLIASGHQNSNRNGSYWWLDYFPYTTIEPPIRFPAGVEKIIITGTGTDNYINEWLVPCGPFMYLFSIKSVKRDESDTYEHWILNSSGEYYLQGDPYTLNSYAIGTIDVMIQVALFDKIVFDRLKNSPLTNNKFGETIWYSELPEFRVDNNVVGPFSMEYYNIPALGSWYFDQKLQTYDAYGIKDSDIPDEIWNLRNYVPYWETAKFFVRPHNPV